VKHLRFLLEASKQTVVSSLAFECDPPVNKENDDSRVLVDFMKNGKEGKYPECSEISPKKTSKIGSLVQIEDEYLVRNQEVSSPQHNFCRNPLKRSLKKQRRKKLKSIPIWRFLSGRTNIIQWFQCYRKT
jgi:hypothetical protein